MMIPKKDTGAPETSGTGINLIFVILLTALTSVCDAASINGTVQIYDRNGNLKKDQSGTVVFLDEIENYSYGQVSTEHVILSQANKKFDPAVLPIMMGTTVEFPNNDNIFHNVFSLSKIKPFDLGLYKQGDSRSVLFDKPGLVKVYCNIHPDMIANILVLGNPYFTLTGQDGAFEIKDVPLGRATLRTWYPHTTRQPEEKIIVSAEGIKNINLEIVESVRLQIHEENITVKHKNKWGQDYPAKY